MSTPCDPGKPCPGCEEMVETGRYNQPGLPAISYQLGKHDEFLQRMLNRIYTNELLRKQLTTRESDDYSIALMDAWAVVADVLSFYQERIANEGFLRTATERRSVLEMARTIGYELNPGVAASSYLAFTVDDTDPKYSKVKVPQGTQAQSLPAPGQLPQTFEISEEFEARVEWNEIKPRLTRRQTLGIGNNDIMYILSLADAATVTTSMVSDFFLVNPDPSLGISDPVVATQVNQIYFRGVATNLQAGELLLLVGDKNGAKKAIVRQIVGVEPDSEKGFTMVEITGTKETPYKVAKKTINLIASVNTGLIFNAVSVAQNVLYADINEESLQALITVNRWDEGKLLEHVSALQTTPASLTGQGIFTLREHIGFFGCNAPSYNNSIAENYTTDWDANGWEIWKTYPNNTVYYSSSPAYGADVYLERKVEGIGKDSWVVIDYPYLDDSSVLTHKYLVYQVDETADQSITGFSISGKATGLKLKNMFGSSLSNSDKDNKLKIRNSTIHTRSETLELIDLPVEDDLEETGSNAGGKPVLTGVSSVILNNMVVGLQIAQPVIVNGELVNAEGVIGHEVAVLKDIVHSRGYTIIYFKDALQYRYRRDTVTINANVGLATHGETVREVLGSGDGTKTNQCFVVKKPPLTYVSAATPSGAESTLLVKVDSIEWQQVLSLYNIGPNSQSYIVRLDNNGDVKIKFGDGKQGARLSSGQENVIATYRSGIGAAGEVSAESIKLLKTRPQGIRDVINPLPASGAQNPEAMDKARTNAPRTVLTMERIVSLKDYEDFARAYTGVGKAQSVTLWNGKTELVHVTVAAANGTPFDPSSTTYQNLRDAIAIYRDYRAMVQIDTFEKRLFQVEATLLIDEKYTAEEVLAEAKSALKEVFSFECRDFGQPVTSAEVISILQQVPGVIAVDLDKLYLIEPAYANDMELGPNQSQPAAILPCSKAKWPEGGDFQKAQLLLVNPVGITLEEKENE